MASLNPPVLLKNSINSGAGQWVSVLTVPENILFGTLQLNITDHGVDPADKSIRVGVTGKSTGNPENQELIEGNASLKPKGRYTNFGVMVKGGERVMVYSDSGDLAIRAALLGHEEPFAA